MASSALQAGNITTARMRVTTSDLASAISDDPQDAFPDVFATQRLVAIMEIASARALKPLLQHGQLSDGVSLDVTHSAPTPCDEVVSAEATYRGQEGKLYAFDVIAKDGGGEIGKAVHKRAIVGKERLEQTAARRISNPTS